MYKILILVCVSVLLSANVLPKKVLTKNCLNDYLNTYTSQKDHKAFVYARESKTGKDRCGWGYGYESAKEAKKGAMKQCTGFQLNAECIIIDTDGEYLVKEGDFTPISQPDDTPLSTEEEQKLLQEAKVIIRGNCLPFFKDYLGDAGHKVFSYSLDANGRYACGKTYNHSTIKSAQKMAITSCNDNKNKRGKQKPKSPCKVYAEGNKILLHSKDFDLAKVTQVEKELSDVEYEAKFNKAKTMIKKGPCLFQMKYYLRGSKHQAFFLAHDKDGTQVCGRSEGEVSENEAFTIALRACDKRLREKNLDAKCTLIAKGFDIVSEVSFLRQQKETGKAKKSHKKQEIKKKIESKKVQELFNVLQSKKIDMHKPVPLKESIKIATVVMNKDLPNMLDEELRLDRVEARDEKMIFHYTLVHFTPKTMPAKKLKSLMYKDIKKQVCSDNETIMMLKKGMKIDYLYKGKEKNPITTFVFDAKTCGLLTNVEQIKKNILNMIKKK